MGRADEHHIAIATRNQLEATQHERTHEDRAQLGVGLYQREQHVAVDFDGFAWLASLDSDEDGPAGEHGTLTGEHPPCETHDELLDAIGRTNDLDGPIENDVHACGRLTGVEQDFAAFDSSPASARGDSLDLRLGQCRPDMIEARAGEKRSGSGHSRHGILESSAIASGSTLRAASPVASRMAGATRVPSSSMACISFV
jgi:hypothetical protein